MMRLGSLIINKIGYLTRISMRVFAVSVILGFYVLTPACKDKTTAPQGECPITQDMTISKIKENYKTLNVQNTVLKGTVIENKDVKNYTYLHLKDATGQIWAAIPKTPVEAGKEIAISNIIVMAGFHSKTFDKTFDIILFAVPSEPTRVCPIPHGEMPGGMTSEMPPGMPASIPHGSMPELGMGADKPKASPQNIKVGKATGKDAYTIEEIYANKKQLSQKPVTVRAKVVKFLPQIMGKNWMHIQDGTGSEENKNYDITVSTLETADIGDEVIVHGTLDVDKDFGAMCAFAVIIEEASMTKAE
jgi:hypothetical protein